MTFLNSIFAISRATRAFVFLLGFLLFAATLQAQSYTAGYTKYQRGDFKGAERSLLQAVTKETAKDAKANSWKLLGICQYMLGNKSGASKSFNEALSINIGLTISSGEVLDEKVIDQFNRIKQEIVAASQPPPPPPPPPPPEPAPPPKPVAKVPAVKPVVVAPTAAVAVPATKGTDSGKGVTTTPSGKPGATFLVVKSDVPDANIMVDGILAGQINTQIEVEPGLIMVEVDAPGIEPKMEKITAIKGQINNITIDVKPKKIKKVAKKKPKKPKKQARQKKKKNDDMFAEPSGSQKAGYNPAAEFESDTGISPYAPAPPPAPYYGQPYQQPYDQVALNNGDYDDRYENRSAQHSNYFIAALPFGAGQFQNRNVSGGLVFFAGEVGALYYYTSKNKEAKSTEEEILLYQQEKEASEDGLTEEDAIYIQEMQAYVANSRKKAKYGIYGFGFLWVVGAIEAIINDPIAKSEPQPKRRGRYGMNLDKEFPRLLPPEERHYKKTWQVHLMPGDEDASNQRDSQGLKLMWELKF